MSNTFARTLCPSDSTTDEFRHSSCHTDNTYVDYAAHPVYQPYNWSVSEDEPKWVVTTGRCPVCKEITKQRVYLDIRLIQCIECDEIIQADAIKQGISHPKHWTPLLVRCSEPRKDKRGLIARPPPRSITA